MVRTHDDPFVTSFTGDRDHDVLTVRTLLRGEGLAFDVMPHRLQFRGDPIASIEVGLRIDAAIAELGHRDHVIVGRRSLRPIGRWLRGLLRQGTE